MKNVFFLLLLVLTSAGTNLQAEAANDAYFIRSSETYEAEVLETGIQMKVQVCESEFASYHTPAIDSYYLESGIELEDLEIFLIKKVLIFYTDLYSRAYDYSEFRLVEIIDPKPLSESNTCLKVFAALTKKLNQNSKTPPQIHVKNRKETK